MKRLFKITVACLLAATSFAGLTACGDPDEELQNEAKAN